MFEFIFLFAFAIVFVIALSFLVLHKTGFLSPLPVAVVSEKS